MVLSPGHVVALQAWGLRRMISCYNGVTRRPHVPRERVLRRIMRSQGIDVEIDPSPREVHPIEDAESGGDSGSENFDGSEMGEEEGEEGEEMEEEHSEFEADDPVSPNGFLFQLQSLICIFEIPRQIWNLHMLTSKAISSFLVSDWNSQVRSQLMMMEHLTPKAQVLPRLVIAGSA